MDETTVTPSSEDQNTQPAEANNTASSGQHDRTIPYDRFAEVNSKYREAQTELEQLRLAQRQREEQDRLARGEHEQVIAELRPKANRVDTLEATLQSYLDAELDSVPESYRHLVPDGDVVARLNWVQKARQSGLFNPPTPPVTDAGVQGGTTQNRDVPKPSETTSTLADLAKQYGHKVDLTSVARTEQRIADRRNRFVAKRKQGSEDKE